MSEQARWDAARLAWLQAIEAQLVRSRTTVSSSHSNTADVVITPRPLVGEETSFDVEVIAKGQRRIYLAGIYPEEEAVPIAIEALLVASGMALDDAERLVLALGNTPGPARARAEYRPAAPTRGSRPAPIHFRHGCGCVGDPFVCPRCESLLAPCMGHDGCSLCDSCCGGACQDGPYEAATRRRHGRDA